MLVLKHIPFAAIEAADTIGKSESAFLETVNSTSGNSYCSLFLYLIFIQFISKTSQIMLDLYFPGSPTVST
jgi:hypothetical protein